MPTPVKKCVPAPVSVSIPIVSVLLPVHNGESTLTEALDSLAAQTLRDIEIVVVDDGSTDATGALLDGWHDPRLRVLHRPHGGLIDALNAGLAVCRGEFVARMDCDDRCHAERLEAQVELARTDPTLGVVGCLVNSFPVEDVGRGFRLYEQWLNGLVTHEQIAGEIFIESPVAHPSALMRRDALVALGGYEERGWPEDYDLWLRFHAAGHRFAKVPRVLLDWREHPSRATRTDSRYSVENFLRAKAHYLIGGPLAARGGLIVWGAGKTGRRLSKHLIRGGRTPDAFVDIDAAKIGGTLRGVQVIAADDVRDLWDRLDNPILLAAVASRGARELIRERLHSWGWTETEQFLCVA